MIPIALITGFLGSGKTTFMRRIINKYRDRRLVYLVNEFSPLDVDAHALSADSDDVVAMPGGSIFCACLVTQFIHALKDIETRLMNGRPPEGVVIEASGVANPKVVERMLRETGLDADYTLSSVVTIIDPSSFPALLQTLPNITAQVEASDYAIINKTDTCPKTALAETEANVRSINPGIEIMTASFCEVDLDLFAEARARGLEGEYAACADPNYLRFSAKPEEDVDVARLAVAFAEAKGMLYRAKGFVKFGGETLYIDFSSTGLRTAKAQPDEQPRIAMIFKGDSYDAGREFASRIDGGYFRPH